MIFIEYSKCSTCQKAKKWLMNHQVDFSQRAIVKETPTVEELKKWHQQSGLPLKKLFNTTGQKYRMLDLKNRLDQMSQEEQYALLASDGMLIKRPILVGDKFAIFGFKEEQWKTIL